MSRSEFRWNKKRKHYAYLHKDIGLKRKNILITSKQYVYKNKKGKKKVVMQNILLERHPNTEKDGEYYVIPKNYLDDEISFDEKVYDWNWSKNDKRKIKRIKKGYRTR